MGLAHRLAHPPASGNADLGITYKLFKCLHRAVFDSFKQIGAVEALVVENQADVSQVVLVVPGQMMIVGAVELLIVLREIARH